MNPTPTVSKPAPCTPLFVPPALPGVPHPAIGTMKDTRRLASLMKDCCAGIESILAEPLRDTNAAERLRKMEADILANWPWLGYSKLLNLRHQINEMEVS